MKQTRLIAARSRTTASLLMAACFAATATAEQKESDWTYFAETCNWYKAVGDTVQNNANMCNKHGKFVLEKKRPGPFLCTCVEFHRRGRD